MRTGRLKFTTAISICLIISAFFSVTSVAKRTIPTVHKDSGYGKTIPIRQLKLFPPPKTAKAGCDDINWASWGSFTSNSATGTVQGADGTPVNVTMTSNFDFGSTPGIYNHAKFDSYPSPVPDATVPQTTWSKGAGGTTTMCFSKTVTNPVLLIASLGNSAGLSAKLDFSLPYVVLFDGGNMVYNSSTSLTGTEGYAIIMFPGDFTCVTINSTTEEFYTNITWGLRPPPFPISINQTSNSCNNVTLTASGGTTYLWNGGDSPDKPTNTFHQSGIYIVTVTNASGCTTSTSTAVTVDPGAPPPLISQTASACGTVTLKATGGVTYLWDGGDTPDKETNTFHKSGTYTVSATSAGGCISSTSKTITVSNIPEVAISGSTTGCGSVSLTATGGVSYLWDGGDTPDKSSNTFHQSGTYTVTVTNADGCAASQSKTIVVNPAATAPTISVSSSTCGSITLAASAGATYLWNGGDTPNKQINTFHQSGTYMVTVTNAAGCYLSASKTITVDVPPAFAVTGNTTGCGSVTITAGSGAASYFWDGGNSPNSAVNTFNTSGTYNVLATFPNKCTATATVTVTVNPNVIPSVDIAASPSASICAGTPVTFTAVAANGGGSPLLQWYRNSVAVSTGAAYTANDLANNDVIECHLINNAVCVMPSEVSSNSITMTVNPIPGVVLSPELTINGDESIRLNPAINGDVVKYHWSPVNGLDDPTAQNPLASPVNTTKYQLTVTSAAGCEASAIVNIKVLKNDIVIPNAFTPNADGVNDNWNIAYLSDYKDAVVDIYSRWGQHLYHSVGYANPWDGTYNSQPVPAGTYYYVIDLNYNNYKRRSGWVAILR